MRSGPPANAGVAMAIKMARARLRLANMAQPPCLHPAVLHRFSNESEHDLRVRRTFLFLHELLFGGAEKALIDGDAAREAQVPDRVFVDVPLLLERALIETNRGLQAGHARFLVQKQEHVIADG